MTNAKSTKRALLASILSVAVCCAMLIGTTFAWFTDSVTSGKNKIVAGNLDVELEYRPITVNEDGTTTLGDWTPVTDETDLFMPAEGEGATLWEPGHTEYAKLRIRNAGTLALKYNFALNVFADEAGTEAEKEYTNKDGGKFKLSDYLVFNKVAADVEAGKRENFWITDEVAEKAAMGTQAFEAINEADQKLLPKGEKEFTLAVYMPTWVGNQANQLTSAKETEGEPTIYLGLTLNATQVPEEADSFGNLYDENANYGISVWDGSVTAVDQLDKNDAAETVALHSAADLAGFAAAINNNQLTDYTVTLDVDVDLNGLAWTPIATGRRSGSGFTGNQFAGTFDGNGKTISGLTIEKNDAVDDDAYGLFGVVNGGTVKNLKLEDVKINLPTNEMAGAAVGMLTGNGTVSGITVSGSVSAKRGNGGVVGRMIKSGTISGCVNNATVTGTSTNVGGIVGAAYYTSNDGVMTIKNCTNKGEVKGSNGYVGGIAGFCAADVTDCTNTAAVIGNGTSVGGIIGEQTSYGTVSGCTNTANIVNNSTVNTAYGTGGIIGWVRYQNDATNYPKTMPIVIKGNTNSGDIMGAFSAGGIVGHVFNTAKITENINTASQITASVSGGFAAGIAGSLQQEAGNKYYDALDIRVNNNISTTSIANINGGLKDQYAYNNSSHVFIVENNKETLS